MTMPSTDVGSMYSASPHTLESSKDTIFLLFYSRKGALTFVGYCYCCLRPLAANEHHTLCAISLRSFSYVTRYWTWSTKLSHTELKSEG